MKVEIKLTPDAREPHAIIFTDEITAEVRHVANLIENDNAALLSVLENGRIFLLNKENVYLIRVENEKTFVYTKTKHYVVAKRLYEFEEVLGKGFMRISKSAIVNLHKIECIEPIFSGIYLIVLKNGEKEYISRKYLPVFKKYLGL